MKDYKKILEGVVNIINTTEKSDIGFANICTYIGENCPELRESEDERMWKLIKKYAHCNISDMALNADHITREQLESWLEKQGEQKPADNQFTPEQAGVLDKHIDKFLEQKHAKLDEKLWAHDDNIFLDAAKMMVEDSPRKNYGWINKGDIVPWFYSLKERLESLKDRVQPQPKQEWSEEDEKKMRAIITIINSTSQSIICSIGQDRESLGNWLKSLKSRVQPQNKCKESLATADLENSLCDIQDGFSDTSYEYRILGEAIEFIRCTEPKPQWKPTDEQMDALESAVSSLQSTALESLYQDLTKN